MNERSTDTCTEKNEEGIHSRRQVVDSTGMEDHSSFCGVPMKFLI